MSRSTLQKLARLVERAEGEAGLREIFRGAFLAIDHGEHQHDLAAGVAHGFDRLHGGLLQHDFRQPHRIGIGALVVLFIWNRLVASGVLKDYNS